MAKKTEDTLLFALIETGALCRQSAIKPLRELGLLAGDDAILLWLNHNRETEFSEMMYELNLESQALRTILFRFQNIGLIDCIPNEGVEDYEVSLTDGGLRLVEALEQHWATLNKHLRGQLKSKGRKKLKKALHQLADSL